MGEVRNEFGGTAHQVVQAGEIHGGVVFHAAPDPPKVVIPRQVPLRGAGMVDREAESECLDASAESGGIAVLSGLPGVGKTALALRWSGQKRAAFPGGDFYVRFAPSQGPVGADVVAALRGCLRALGKEEAQLPQDEGELATLFRSCTAGAPVLVVLEDVTDAAQVRPFAPGTPGSVVLVTSHRRFVELEVVDGARPVPLRPLEPADGLALLEQLCGRDRIATDPLSAARIAGHCSGLPIALRVAASHLALRRHLTLADLEARLADDTRRLDALRVGEEIAVAAVFQLAYEGLPPGAAALYRALGAYPGLRWDAPTAAALAGIGEREAEAALDELHRSSLLDETEDARYTFHGLVRLHASSLADDPAGVLRRALAYLLSRAAHADRDIMGDRLRAGDHVARLGGEPSPFADRSAALAWLDRERAELLAVLRAAAAEERHREVRELAEAMTALYLNIRYVADWLESGELGARASAADGAPGAEARMRSLLSRPLLDLGERERAREELDRAIVCADRTADALLRASVREFDGRWYDTYAPGEALAVWEDCLARYHETDDPRGLAIGTFFLGRAQDAAGRHGEAAATLAAAAAAFAGLSKGPDHRMAARARAAHGEALWHLGRDAEAVAVLEEATTALEECGARPYLAAHLESLATLTGERTHLERALRIYEEGGSPRAATVRALLAEQATGARTANGETEPEGPGTDDR